MRWVGSYQPSDMEEKDALAGIDHSEGHLLQSDELDLIFSFYFLPNKTFLTSVIIKSDNPVYEEELDALAARSLPVIGKVIGYGRRI
ncbi:hypothetical protein [Nitrosomonas sp.]|uniref:hypothetical protein n=1 Tax=Nitrosomonas sp. TaxID=42353 RepID=UPI0026308065|nr:hypothetical protein [Nitrosomonas sp.]